MYQATRRSPCAVLFHDLTMRFPLKCGSVSPLPPAICGPEGFFSPGNRRLTGIIQFHGFFLPSYIHEIRRMVLEPLQEGGITPWDPCYDVETSKHLPTLEDDDVY